MPEPLVRKAEEQAQQGLMDLAVERDQYHRLYLQERITGLDAQIKLAQVLREQAEVELQSLG